MQKEKLKEVITGEIMERHYRKNYSVIRKGLRQYHDRFIVKENISLID